MSQRVICPNPLHKEKTPSFVAHPSGKFWKCFGCGYLEWSEHASEGERKEESYKEDLEESLRYVETLPEVSRRGLVFRQDSRGYYITWPSRTYYKLRLADTDSGSKYRCPIGHRKPLFADLLRKTNVLWIIEGEINALSFRLVSDDDVVSPGGCSDFARDDYLTSYQGYDRVIMVVDYDKAGVQAIQALKPKLVKFCPDVATHLVKQDFNEVLCERGKDALKKEVEMLRKL